MCMKARCDGQRQQESTFCNSCFLCLGGAFAACFWLVASLLRMQQILSPAFVANARPRGKSPEKRTNPAPVLGISLALLAFCKHAWMTCSSSANLVLADTCLDTGFAQKHIPGNKSMSPSPTNPTKLQRRYSFCLYFSGILQWFVACFKRSSRPFPKSC